MVFKKNKCNKCGKKVNDNASFCPNCGMPINHAKNNFKKKENEYGLLGKNDYPENPFSEDFKIQGMPPGFNFLLKTLMKKFGKEFRELSEEMQKKLIEEENKEGETKKNLPTNNKKVNKKGLNIHITSSNGQPPKIKVSSFGNPNMNGMMAQEMEPQKEEEVKNKEFSNKKSKEYSKLPKKNPETNIKRFSDKINYEITVPGLKTLENIALKKLEESVEIKAIGNDCSYFKSIPLKLKLKNYSIEGEKIILEFEE